MRHLPGPARAIATSLQDAVAAAGVRDPQSYDAAAAKLAALNPEQVGLVLGAVVRSLLERLHPDGLTGDDVRAVLEHCVRAAAGWRPALDTGVLVGLVAGALGVHAAEEEARQPSPSEVAAHAPLLIADLLSGAGAGSAGALDAHLDAAFTEIARAERVDLP